jgi:hypothetical protein
MSFTLFIDDVEYDIEDLNNIVRWAEALDEAGVDNWEGYDEARAIFREKCGEE